jgi:hypothetical protein
MSLSITVHRRNPATGELERFPADHPGDELGGFAVWRQQVWGSDAARELGLKLLPTLGDRYDVWAEGEWLDVLEREAQTLLADAPALAERLEVWPDVLQRRCENIIQAVARARAVGGAVSIG